MVNPVGLMIEGATAALDDESHEEHIERLQALNAELKAEVTKLKKPRFGSAILWQLPGGVTADEAMGIVDGRAEERQGKVAKSASGRKERGQKRELQLRLGQQVFQQLHDEEHVVTSMKGAAGRAAMQALVVYAGNDEQLKGSVKMERLRTLAAQSVVDIENWPDIPGTSLPAGAPRRRPAAATAAAEEEEEEEDDDEEEQEEEYQSESEGELSSDSEDERLANEFNAHNGN